MKDVLSLERGLSIINRFVEAKVLVVGDLIMDHFIWGDVKRISPEAPVPIVNVKNESLMLGGSANVAHNICSLGAAGLICGVIGKDGDGRSLLRELKSLGIPGEGVVVEEGRPTTIKTRVIAHGQQVVRFDKEMKEGITPETMGVVIDRIRTSIDHIDVIVISDYSKGLVTKELTRKVVGLAKKNGKKVVVDPKVKHADYYSGVTVVTPNNDEASQISGIEIDSDETLSMAGKKLLRRFSSDAVLITRGENGMSLFERGKKVCHIPTIAREVYDVSGAGDTVVAVMSLALALGASYMEAAALANFAAGIVVGKIGTATVSVKELSMVVSKILG